MENTVFVIFDKIWQKDNTFYPQNYLEFNVWNKNAKIVQLDKVISSVNYRNYSLAIKYLVQAFLN